MKFILRVLFTVLTPYKKLKYFSNYIQTVQNVQNFDCVIMYSFFVVFFFTVYHLLHSACLYFRSENLSFLESITHYDLLLLVVPYKIIYIFGMIICVEILYNYYELYFKGVNPIVALLEKILINQNDKFFLSKSFGNKSTNICIYVKKFYLKIINHFSVPTLSVLGNKIKK